MFKNKRNYYITYTLVFIMMAAAVYSFFWRHGKTLVWETDGFQQHYKALEYYAEWLRSLVSNLFQNHTLSAPSFHFGIGYGSDILTSLHYYAVGDPLTALAIFVPSSRMVHFYDFLIILRLYLAGLAFSGYFFYMKKKIGPGVLAGALTYIFCGYALFAGVRHPFFLNPMIYFPLLLLGVEKILKEKKPYLFILSVFVSAISNFYFFYMLVLLTVFYVLARLYYTGVAPYEDGKARWFPSAEQWKKIGLTILKIGGYASIGVMMSAVVLVPVLILFFGDARTAAGGVFDLFYPRAYYEEFLISFIGTGSPGYWSRLGYTAITLPAVFLLFLKKKQHVLLKAGFVFLTICFLLPVFGHISNGFSYVTNRWCWGYSLLVAYILAVFWEDLLKLTKKERIQSSVLIALYVVIQLCLGKGKTYLLILAVFSFVILMPDWKKIRHIHFLREAGLLFGVLLNIVCVAYIMYGRNGYAAHFQDMATFSKALENTEAKAIRAADTEGGFYRYSGSAMSVNASILHGIPNTQYHWSLSNGAITDFIREMGLATTSSFNYVEPDGRAGLLTLAGVKYYVIPKKHMNTKRAPGGFVQTALSNKNLNKWYKVYKNKYTLPLGYTYSGYIAREDYLQMSMEQRAEAVLQGVVLKEKPEGFSTITPEFETEELAYEVNQTSEHVTMQGNSFVVTKEGASITLEFQGIKNSETYLKVKGMNYRGCSKYLLYGNDKEIDPLDLYGEEEWNALSEKTRASILKSNQYWSEKTRVAVTVRAYDEENSFCQAELPYATPKFSWYIGMQDFMINLRYSSKPRTSIKLTFPSIGIYSFDELKVIAQPMAHYGSRVSALGAEGLENVDIHENAAHATNLVTGEITVSEPKLLCLAIPYTGGWTAYVDGKETEIYRANTMYMALPLEKGRHDIRLTYRTPGKLAGGVLSFVGIAVFCALILYEKKKQGRMPENSVQEEPEEEKESAKE